MRRAHAMSASSARKTSPSGTGWSGSSGSWRKTAAVYRRISSSFCRPRAGPGRDPVSLHDVRQRRFQIAITQPFDDDPIHGGHLARNRMGARHSDNRADPHRGVQRRPEVKGVGVFGRCSGRDNAPEQPKRVTESIHYLTARIQKGSAIQLGSQDQAAGQRAQPVTPGPSGASPQ